MKTKQIFFTAQKKVIRKSDQKEFYILFYVQIDSGETGKFVLTKDLYDEYGFADKKFTEEMTFEGIEATVDSVNINKFELLNSVEF